MSTQLDPVTGAPLLTPDLGNIDQLPYKVQPVPLQDQTNQPQLGRAYLYPDDVPPVLANINAMNGNQQDQAQTLHTDGNHALKVAVQGGSGGATIAASTYSWGDVGAFYVNPNDAVDNIHTHYNTYVFGIGIAWELDIPGATFPVQNQLDIGFNKAAGGRALVASVGIAIQANDSGQPLSGMLWIPFVPAFLPTPSGFRNDTFDCVDIWVGNETGSGFYFQVLASTDG